MRTVLLAESRSDVLGGQRVALQIAAALQSKFRVVLACPGRGALAGAAGNIGVEVRLIPSLGQSSPLALAFGVSQLHKLLEELHPGLVYVNGLTSLPAIYMASRKSRVPMVLHVHHLVPSPMNRAVLRWIAAHNPTGTTVACSNAVASFAGLPNQSTHIIHNGVNVDRFCVRSREEIRMRKELGSSEDRFLVTYVGDLGGVKAHQLVFSAAIQAASRCKQLQAIFPGRILPAGKSMVSQAKADAAAAGFTDLFLFPGWCKDMERIYPLCDLTILGHEEGFPLSGLESAACGTPLALPRAGGAEELGLMLGMDSFYESADSESLANCILDSARRHESSYRKKLSAHVRKRFSTSIFSNRVCKLVDDLILQ